MKNLKELTAKEMKTTQGGGLLTVIKKGIAAYNAVKEFFSGRPQI